MPEHDDYDDYYNKLDADVQNILGRDRTIFTPRGGKKKKITSDSENDSRQSTYFQTGMRRAFAQEEKINDRTILDELEPRELDVETAIRFHIHGRHFD